MRYLPLFLPLLLPASALAQDAPTPAAAEKPAGSAIADALVKLRGAKLLKRLTQPRHYEITMRGRTQLLTLSGEEVGPILKLRLLVKRLDRPRVIDFVYEMGSDGRPKAFEITTTRRPGTDRENKKTVRTTISGGKAVSAEVGKGAGPTKEAAWTDEHVGATLLWLVVPSLFDQGLPRVLKPRIVREEGISRGGAPAPVEYVRSEKPIKSKEGVLVHTFSCKTGRQDITITVAADGPRKGLILSFAPDPKMSFHLISAKEAAQLEKDAPLLANEAKAISLLRNLKRAQRRHKSDKGGFATGLEALEQQDKYLAEGLEKLQSTYLVLMRTAPDKTKWMAIAVPAEPGKTGKRYFVTNQDGVVHTSSKKLELDDSCAIPAGATPLK